MRGTVEHDRLLLLAALAVAAPGCNPSSSDAPDSAVDALACPATPAVQLDTFDSGAVTGSSARVPVVASPSDLLIVSVAALDGNFGTLQVASGTRTLQVAMGTNPCGRNAILWAVGDIEAPLDHVDVQMSRPGTFDVFVARFAGLPADAGASLSLYAHSWGSAAAPLSGAAPRVSVCAGAAVVTTMVSCAPLSLRPDSSFTLIGSAQGMASAATIPSAPGASGAD